MYDKLIAEKCVEDASEYIWLRWEARSVLIGNRKCQIKLCSAISLIDFWNVWFIWINEDYDGSVSVW